MAVLAGPGSQIWILSFDPSHDAQTVQAYIPNFSTSGERLLSTFASPFNNRRAQ
jgi:hypothetical protein